MRNNMRNNNYDNALTLLFEGKENKLESNILTLEGDDLYREIAFVLTELSLIDKKSGKKIITENERRFLEESFFSKIKNAWKNLWGDANSQVQQSAGQNLTQQQQQAIQKTQKRVAELTKKCVEISEADWSVKNLDYFNSFGLTNSNYDDSDEAKKKYMEETVKSCVNHFLETPNGKSIIGKLGDFLRNTIGGRVLVGLVAIGAMGYVTGAFGAHDVTKSSDIDDGDVDIDDVVDDNTSDSTLKNSEHVKVNADGSLTKVGVGDDLTVGVVERDHGVTDLKQDQVQQTADNIIKIIKDLNEDPDLGGEQVNSITLKFHSDKSNTDLNTDNDGDGIGDSNDCVGGPCAETHNDLTTDAVMKIVKQGLDDAGISTHVKVVKEIGGLADNQVNQNTTDAKAQQGTTVQVVDVDAPVKSVTTTEFVPGQYGPLVNTYPSIKPKACSLVLDGVKTPQLGNGDGLVLRGSIIPKKIKKQEDGLTFDGKIVRGNEKYSLNVLGGFDGHLVVEVIKPEGVKGMYLIPCGEELGGEKIKRGQEDNKQIKGDQEGGKKIKRGQEDNKQIKGDQEGGGENEITVSKEFLKGNRNTQLAHLSTNFLPEGSDFWSNLWIKKGTSIPSGFLDAALAQGKLDSERYLKAYHKYLVEKGLMTRKINSTAWLARIRSKKNLSIIRWIRNTRKGVGSFINKIKKNYPSFQIGERQKAKVSKPGKEGEPMGVAGESLNGRFDLLMEINLGQSASQAGFDESIFMKNLPQFIEMLSMMYYSTNGKKLPYNKEAVLKSCKKYGCKSGGSKSMGRVKSDDYNFTENNKIDKNPLTEEVNKMKHLMMYKNK